ncbi:MAG: hypothetical protein FJY82_05585 [Candidatus Aminicenantes bacterium]|nr:hypothetical protein [Candidatus Aminicenantes bacterium]
MLGHAEVVGFLFRLVRFRRLRDRIWRHIESCPSCQARLAGREDARRVLFRADDAGGLDGLWPAVRRAISDAAVKPVPASAFTAAPSGRRNAWRWAAAVGGLAAAALLTVGIIRTFMSGTVRAPAFAGANGGLRIEYARIAGQTAQTIIVREKNPDMIIVWVEKI